MPKMSTELVRRALSGPTMGTRWQVLTYLPPEMPTGALQAALAGAVAEVDAQMSTWRADSDVNRLSEAAPGVWVDLPLHLMAVLARGVQIGAQSCGAFDIGMGDAVAAWGFAGTAANEAAIRAAHACPRRPAHEVLELDVPGARARKHGALRLDLNGIAKGYGVDRLVQVMQGMGIGNGLAAIDGELRALGCQPDGSPWPIAVEAPDRQRRAVHSVLTLQDAAVATSGDYRHWITVNGRDFSHTMDPRRGAPLAASPASVTVLAEDCTQADAWATALMVLGAEAGLALAGRLGLSALILSRDGGAQGCGIFARDLAA